MNQPTPRRPRQQDAEHRRRRPQPWWTRVQTALTGWCRRMAVWIRRTSRLVQEGSPAEYVAQRLDAFTVEGEQARRARRQQTLARVTAHVEAHIMKIKIVLSSLLLALSCVACAASPSVFTALACAAMGFSWLGDALLMQYPPVARRLRQYFLWGMAAFFCAQACYTRLFLRLGEALGTQSLLVVYGFIAVFVAAGVAAWVRTMAFNRAQMLVLRIGALLYAVIVSLMAASACALFVARPWPGLLMLVGGLMFYVSDLLIALSNFGSLHLRHRDIAIWALYAPAQALLLTGVWALSAGL